MIAYQLGICCVYIVFVASNIKQVINTALNVFQKTKTLKNLYQQVTDQYWEPLDIQTHMFILLIPLMLINYIRNLKLLAPFSTFANLITFVGLAMIMVYVFEDLPPINERAMVNSLRNFSLYFGTTLFALEAVGVVIILQINHLCIVC